MRTSQRILLRLLRSGSGTSCECPDCTKIKLMRADEELIARWAPRPLLRLIRPTISSPMPALGRARGWQTSA